MEQMCWDSNFKCHWFRMLVVFSSCVFACVCMWSLTQHYLLNRLWTALNMKCLCFSPLTAILPLHPSQTFPFGVLSVVPKSDMLNVHVADLQKMALYTFSFLDKKQGQFLRCSPMWHIFIEQENKLPKDLLTHLAEVISKSRGRWCHGQILDCFRGVLICIHKWQPCLAVRNIFVCYMTECQSFPAVCGASVGNWLIYHGEPIDWEPRDVFVGGGGLCGPPLFICSKHVNSEWATQQPPLFTAGIRVWKCWHTERRAAPETPGIPPRRRWAEGEVEPWNALRRVSHLFTSWTRWTLPESATSTTASLSHLFLPLSSMFCSLTYPYAPLYSPLPFNLLTDRHSSSWHLIGRHLRSCIKRPNPTPTWPPSPRCSPCSCKHWGHKLMMRAKQMSVEMWVKLGSMWSTARVQEVPHTHFCFWHKHSVCGVTLTWPFL